MNANKGTAPHSPLQKRRTTGTAELLFEVLLLCYMVFFLGPAQAGVTEPDPRAQDAFDFMNVLAKKGLHDLKNERWNAYGQFTYISSWKSGFPALYTNLNGSTNSLLPGSERSFTGTATLYLGLKTWNGGEVYFVPEMISMRPLSDLKGLGGAIQNFELQKGGSETPIYYRSRLFFKQTWGFGGERIQLDSDPMQLGTTVDSRRLVVRVGNFSVIDFFDRNSYSGDLRRQFLNMAFMTYAAFDFAADARGYTWGAVGEYFHDNWTMRFGHVATSIDPNQLPLDTRIFKYYGQQIEFERRHLLYGHPGAIRVLAYRNHENMGKFSDAIAAFQSDHNKNATTCTGFNYGSGNASAPDLCWARKPNDKMGIGINLEQQVLDGIGIFLRGMYSDGKTEVFSYTSTDRSISLGALVNGSRWGRKRDLLGVGFAAGWISSQHAKYLNMGGVDGFIGDGRIKRGAEHVVDIFYSVNVLSSLWVTADYQHIANPGFNADRGPVNIYGMRIHAEF
ncbi:carbohydrate porin [Nitrosovibrio tenuis]|uniref:Carbohydrate-selective porin, OprB family n=1 Tax=Nitrosovibrio tenuis TaxID=1233 RepID=A0A1H7GIR6_9PROT|nr:carbohydrate porin [Nitrosovibrio tenuis]SEK37954.1 Carbohydrate-selective porin, OprB family [Nitrosovibrio tenuis]